MKLCFGAFRKRPLKYANRLDPQEIRPSVEFEPSGNRTFGKIGPLVGIWALIGLLPWLGMFQQLGFLSLALILSWVQNLSSSRSLSSARILSLVGLEPQSNWTWGSECIFGSNFTLGSGFILGLEWSLTGIGSSARISPSGKLDTWSDWSLGRIYPWLGF
jgi:hypothetical protein